MANFVFKALVTGCYLNTCNINISLKLLLILNQSYQGGLGLTSTCVVLETNSSNWKNSNHRRFDKECKYLEVPWRLFATTWWPPCGFLSRITGFLEGNRNIGYQRLESGHLFMSTTEHHSRNPASRVPLSLPKKNQLNPRRRCLKGTPESTAQ